MFFHFLIVSTIFSLWLYINPYLPNPVSIFKCALIFLFIFCAISSTAVPASFEPIDNMMLFFTSISMSFFTAVEDIINISSFIPASLSFSASSTVATAKKSIPLSIRNFVYSTNPSPYPFPFTTAIILTFFPLSFFSCLFIMSLIIFILCFKFSLSTTNAFILLLLIFLV